MKEGTESGNSASRFSSAAFSSSLCGKNTAFFKFLCYLFLCVLLHDFFLLCLYLSVFF